VAKCGDSIIFLLDVSVALYNPYMSRMLMAATTKRPVWKVHVGLVITGKKNKEKKTSFSNF